ncbi:MAG: aldo/keto reductase [bacterium]
MAHTLDRRTFFLSLTGMAGTLLTTDFSLAAAELASKPMPTRILGRTNERVSALGLGTAPMGHAYIGEDKAVPIIHAALDQGIRYIDTARIYDDAESYIGKVAPSRRDEMFLVTKVWADSASKAEENLTTSLKTLGVDHVDLCHIHCLGNRDPEKVLADDGTLAYLLKAKEKGLTRFIGATGHHNIPNFPAVLDTGLIDVLMVGLNFVDHHIYKFHETVIPLAKKHGMGIVAMKVFGGRMKMDDQHFFAGYKTPGPAQMPKELLEEALRYCLNLDGVTTALAGVYNRDEILEDARWAKEYMPMTSSEIAAAEEKGKDMAPGWGPRFGSPA